MPRIASRYGKDPKRMPFDFPDVLAAIAPRPVFVCAPRRDANFELAGVEDCLRAAGSVYQLLGASGKLEAVHPDCEHSFPADQRRQDAVRLDEPRPSRPQPAEHRRRQHHDHRAAGIFKLDDPAFKISA